MAKTVTLSDGRVFSTMKDAQAYFDDLRENTAPGQFLAEPERSYVIDLYERYCVATEYVMQVAVNVTTKRVVTSVGGQHVTSTALAIVNPAGELFEFSLKKAIQSVAA